MKKLYLFFILILPNVAVAELIFDQNIPKEFHGVWSTNCTNDNFESNTYMIFENAFLYLSESEYPYNQLDIGKVGKFHDYMIAEDKITDEVYYFYKIENNSLIEKSSPDDWDKSNKEFLNNEGSIYYKCEEVRYLTNENFKTIIDFSASEVPISCSGSNINSKKCIKSLFNYIDITNDGNLSSAELTRALKTLALYTYFLLNEQEISGDFIGVPNMIAVAIAPSISEIILKNYDFDDSGTLRVDEFQHDLIKPRLLKDLKNNGSEIYSVQDIFNIFQNFY